LVIQGLPPNITSFSEGRSYVVNMTISIWASGGWGPPRPGLKPKSAAAYALSGIRFWCRCDLFGRLTPPGASKQMEESMSEKQLEEFAHTKRKEKPEPTVVSGLRLWARKRTSASGIFVECCPAAVLDAVGEDFQIKETRVNDLGLPRDDGEQPNKCCVGYSVALAGAFSKAQTHDGAERRQICFVGASAPR
jgi:hypothetical protein